MEVWLLAVSFSDVRGYFMWYSAKFLFARKYILVSVP
jgi:hypothetical protein